MLTAKMKKNQFVAMARPLLRQKRVARRDASTFSTSSQRRCHESTMTRNTLVQMKRCDKISGGETVLSSFQYPGISPQVAKAAMPAMSASVSRDFALDLRKIDI